MLNGICYEEENGFNDYERYDSKRKRSRSKGRSERKHHHSSGTHRRRRKRSRSRNRTRNRTPTRVHINPNFTNLGPTASLLLETNNMLEAEVVRLRNELSCTSIRIRALENELSNGTAIRANLEKELSIYRANQQKLQQTVSKNSQVISSLRKEAGTIRKAHDELLKIHEQTEMQLSANTEQVSFLTKRNEVLGKKCEELVEKSRIYREERDDAVKLVNSLRREVETVQAAADLRLVEYKRMENELCAAREKERMWKLERVELERKLTTKKSLLAHEKRRNEEQRKRDRAQLEQLQNKLKSEQPGWETQLGVEAVLRAVECVKREFEGQIEQLSSQITGGRPPRTLSAPPLSYQCLPSSSRSPTTLQSSDASTLNPDAKRCQQTEAVTDTVEQELKGSYENTGNFECSPDIIVIEERTSLSH